MFLLEASALTEALGKNPGAPSCLVAAAATALGKQKNRRASRQLIELLGSPSVEVSTAAATALGNIGDASAPAVGALFKATSSGDTYVRSAAEQALAKLSPRREDLIPLLKDESSAFVRAAAAAKLGAAKDPTDLKDLSKLLDDPDPGVRDSVLKILSQYTDDVSKAQLRSFLDDDDVYRREAAAQLIGVWQWKESSPALAARVKDKDPRVRVQVVKSLGRIGDASTAGAIIDAAHDADARVRLAVAEALTNVAFEQVLPTLHKLSEDENAEVRQAAIEALRKRSSE